jgi:hypothetical protein
MMQKADRFTQTELIAAIIGIDEVNLSLKSSKLNPELILDDMILKICGISQSSLNPEYKHSE